MNIANRHIELHCYHYYYYDYYYILLYYNVREYMNNEFIHAAFLYACSVLGREFIYLYTHRAYFTYCIYSACSINRFNLDAYIYLCLFSII